MSKKEGRLSEISDKIKGLYKKLDQVKDAFSEKMISSEIENLELEASKLRCSQNKFNCLPIHLRKFVKRF